MAAAKCAGYKVTAIDAFADAETTALADAVIVVKYSQNGFDGEALLNAVKSLPLDKYAGFVYGSGLDAQPALLSALAELLPCIGNTADTVAKIKNADVFFAALANHSLNFPPTFLDKSAFDVALNSNGAEQVLLKKSAGGCGGTHIQYSNADATKPNNDYFQAYLQGQSISLLFLAAQNNVIPIGFNEQWLAPSDNLPFRFGGAVSGAILSPEVSHQLTNAAQQLALTFGLKGLNSLDAIVQNDTVYVLEINPRLSATFALYADAAGLFATHLQASLGECSYTPKASETCHAMALVYAEEAITVSKQFVWPSWVTDTPLITADAENLTIAVDMPICTVTANAQGSLEAALLAKQLAQSRVKILLEMLKKH